MRKLLLAFLLLFCYAATAQARQVLYDGMKVTWTPSYGAEGYILYWGENVESLLFKRDVENVTEYPLSALSLDPDRAYYFRVKAYAAVDRFSDLSPYCRACPYARRAVLSWSASSSADVKGYQVFMRSGGQAQYDYSDPLYDGPELQWETPVLCPGETYYFCIRAYDHAGNASTVKEVSVTPTGSVGPYEADTTAPADVPDAAILFID